MGIDPTQAKILIDSDPTFAGAYSTDTQVVYVNDLAHGNASAAVNTVGHETQHYIDDKKSPDAVRTEQYESNREEYAGMMGNATEDYLGFNFAQSGNSLTGSNSYSLGSTAEERQTNVNLVLRNTDNFNSEAQDNIDLRMIHPRESQIIGDLAPKYVALRAMQGETISVEEARDVLTNQVLRQVNGAAYESGEAGENWDKFAHNFLRSQVGQSLLTDESGEVISDRYGNPTPIFGVNSNVQRKDDTIFAPNEQDLPMSPQTPFGESSLLDYAGGRIVGTAVGAKDAAVGTAAFVNTLLFGTPEEQVARDLQLVTGLINLPETLEDQARQYHQAAYDGDLYAVGQMEGNYDGGSCWKC